MLMKLLYPSYGKGEFWRRTFFLMCQKWSKISEKFSFKKCHEAHQTDQQNVLNVKMYVCGGAKNYCLFQGSRVVKTGHNWLAEFRHCHFVIWGGVGARVGGRPSPTCMHPWCKDHTMVFHGTIIVELDSSGP